VRVIEPARRIDTPSEVALAATKLTDGPVTDAEAGAAATKVLQTSVAAQSDQTVVQAAYTEPATTPATPVRRTVPAPVFTLSALPTESLRDSEAADPAPAPVADGQVLYVTANSVNVRQEPSTEASVVGKLTRGEAALVLWQEGEDWARIIIEGDGLEGYVASRFLSANAP
jgi:uncharacterized protein YgiM (DUF1202 family)